MDLQVKTFTFLPQAFAENTYLLYDGSGKCVVVDPGCYTASEQREISDFIESEGLELDKILLTHAHLDHIFGLSYFKNKYGVPIYGHEKERFNLERAVEYSGFFGFSMEPVPLCDVWIDEGDQVSFGNTTLDILFTPGHSPGHVSFHHGESSQLFSGDVIFRDSFGRVDLPGGSIKVLKETIINRIFTLPEETKIYAGHLSTTTVGREKKANPIYHY